MIVSTQHNFLFVHVPKTAGSSIADAMRPYCRPRGRSLTQSVLRRLPIVEAPDKAHFRVHDPATKIIAKLSQPVFDQFLSFACVRNPFDHAVSHFE